MEATCQRCAHTHTHAGDCGHTHDQQGTGFLILSFLLLVGGVILRYLQLPFWMIPGVEVLWFLLAFLPTVVRTITLSAIPSYTTPSGVRIFSLNSVISSFPFLRS